MCYFCMARRDDVVAWKHFFLGFRCPTASLSQYVSYSSKKIYILLETIVFWIKNYYKHVDITQNVSLNISQDEPPPLSHL